MAKKLDLFKAFFNSEKAGGFVLIACTCASLLISNTQFASGYTDFWHTKLSVPFLPLTFSIEHWINDGLMTIFFLLIGLEIERELYVGELSILKNALLPIFAAIGGMVVPALIHFSLNAGTVTQSGFGIPMATDIAFALGILSLAGRSVPVSLKVFLTALAIIDDLGAITVIALFYTKGFSWMYFAGAMLLFLLLFILGKKKINNLFIYLLGGVVLWYLMLKSGVHATIAGVLLAFAIPFHKDDSKNISYKLQHFLHLPVAFIILPIFALANTAIVFPKDLVSGFSSNNSLGIFLGLFAGKFIGIFLFSFLSVKAKLTSLSNTISWLSLAGVAFLGGIGFTMSIFITNLAFDDVTIINNSKIAILVGSLLASVTGIVVLKRKHR
ncbi:Na+/H+ antiporter NhaA [Longitalea arenae]|uniref:Na+/H+ antiporter NhaA n=1 Tax=Longitalea arenae TaxID=2812558 RepID=UPI0019674B24|nr:Na+/H+ antiporter NhaA [Longitalea arenae]